MPDPSLQEAMTLAKEGKRAEAQNLVAQYLKANPNDATGWIAMARIVDDPQRALQCWQRAAALRPDDPRIAAEIAKIEAAPVDLFDDLPIADTSATTQPPTKRRSRLFPVLGIIAGLIVLCIALVLVGPRIAATVSPCGRFGISETLEPLDLAYDKFKDQSSVAESAPRISLAGPIAEMQATYREAQALPIPPCATEVHEALLTYMDLEISSLLAFLAQEEDAVVTTRMLNAVEAEQHYLELSIAMILDTAINLQPTP